VCLASACVAAALKRGRLAHAFRGPTEAAPELLDWAERLKTIEHLNGQRG